MSLNPRWKPYLVGTGIAAVAAGRIDALAGVVGMLAGGALFGLSYGWVRQHVETVWALGKVRLPEWTRSPDAVWFGGLVIVVLGVFWVVERVGGGTGKERNP